MQQQHERLSRLEVREVRCPECGAGPAAKCLGARGKARESNHLSRLKVAEALREAHASVARRGA